MNSCYKRQLVINKLPLPLDVVHIVYDYCFKSIIDVQRQKKAAMLDTFKYQTCVETREMYTGLHYKPRVSDIVGYFVIYPKNIAKEEWGEDDAETYLSCIICPICGDFINPKTKAGNENVAMRQSWRRQYQDDEWSPFLKVTCNDMCRR